MLLFSMLRMRCETDKANTAMMSETQSVQLIKLPQVRGKIFVVFNS